MSDPKTYRGWTLPELIHHACANDDHIAALERELEDEAATRNAMGDILTRTVNVLRGEPDDRSLHSWARIPDEAADMKQRAEEAEAEGIELARLLGMGSEREARLMAERDEAQRDATYGAPEMRAQLESALAQLAALREVLLAREPDDPPAGICRVCHELTYIQPGDDQTRECHYCAHDILDKARAILSDTQAAAEAFVREKWCAGFKAALDEAMVDYSTCTREEAARFAYDAAFPPAGGKK